MLAGIIALALTLSFFHGAAFDADGGFAPVTVAEMTDHESRQNPAHPAPHQADHCLTHVSAMAAQDTAVTIDYATHGYRIVSMRSPEAAETLSPFEPPRA